MIGSVVGCAVGVITVVVGGMAVIVGGTAVAGGDNVDVGVGWVGPEQATNRKRMLMTAWELIFFIIAPPNPLITTGSGSLPLTWPWFLIQK